MDSHNTPKGPSEHVSLNVEALVIQLRQGRFEEADSRFTRLYEEEGKNPDNAAHILKHWAMALVCLGEYTRAVAHYHQAAEIYGMRGNNIESWFCTDAARTIEDRENLPVEFNEFVRQASGNTLQYPRNYL